MREELLEICQLCCTAQIGHQCLQVGEEDGDEVLIEDGVVLLQLVHSLTHFVRVLDSEADILLLEGTTASIGESAVVLVHL